MRGPISCYKPILTASSEWKVVNTKFYILIKHRLIQPSNKICVFNTCNLQPWHHALDSSFIWILSFYSTRLVLMSKNKFPVTNPYWLIYLHKRLSSNIKLYILKQKLIHLSNKFFYLQYFQKWHHRLDSCSRILSRFLTCLILMCKNLFPVTNPYWLLHLHERLSILSFIL